MALTQVRAQFQGTWYTLTYNPETGRYETYITPEGTSFHQPWGYYSIKAEATNQNGDIAEIDGGILPALRLIVRETEAPTLRLVSPAPGFLTTQNLVFVFEATDEDGGSGVNPNSFSLAGASVEAIPGGYRFTWTAQGWTEGQHTLTATVSDYDGNESTVTGAYIVDTIPPTLIIKTPYKRHVVDTETIHVSGTASDLNGVTVLANGVEIGGETFAADVPLEIGENNVQITARDAAGLETTETIYVIRLITDRTQADVDKLRALLSKDEKYWTTSEREWFYHGLVKGAYNATDFNRVEIAVKFLKEELERHGYAPSVSIKTDWTTQDIPTAPQAETYRQNVETIRDTQKLDTLSAVPVPSTMQALNQDGANQLEKALVETDAIFPNYFAWTAGEISCGGY